MELWKKLCLLERPLCSPLWSLNVIGVAVSGAPSLKNPRVEWERGEGGGHFKRTVGNPNCVFEVALPSPRIFEEGGRTFKFEKSMKSENRIKS